MIRAFRQWRAKRRLAEHVRHNLQRLATAPTRDTWGRFTSQKVVKA